MLYGFTWSHGTGMRLVLSSIKSRSVKDVGDINRPHRRNPSPLAVR